MVPIEIMAYTSIALMQNINSVFMFKSRDHN